MELIESIVELIHEGRVIVLHADNCPEQDPHEYACGCNFRLMNITRYVLEVA